MALTAARLAFSQASIGRIPERMGVYVLWRGDEPIHAGKTVNELDTLRKALQRHLRGVDLPGCPRVTHFSWEICADPAARHFELVLELGRDIEAAGLEPLPELRG